jgi:hypothetical protein
MRRIAYHTIAAVAVAAAGMSLTAAQASKPTTLKCAGPGYTATYSAESRGVVPTVDVTFRTKPSSTVVERALRACITAAADTMFIRSEMLAQAWLGDDLLPVSDGSTHMAYDPKTKAIRTWNERQGVKVVASQGSGFFT